MSNLKIGEFIRLKFFKVPLKIIDLKESLVFLEFPENKIIPFELEWVLSNLK